MDTSINSADHQPEYLAHDLCRGRGRDPHHVSPRVELDDVRDRFYYVKQGIEYLEEGIQYLRDNPTLLDDLGWFCGNKVGRADEHVQYRRLFKLDDDLHPEGRLAEDRDNWLVSKEWYGGQPVGQKEVEAAFERWGSWQGLVYWFWDWEHQS